MTGDAPFFGDIAEGPDGGHAMWLRTADGLRIRLGIWPKGENGSVLLLPGRTEYVEKYGRTAAALASRGYGCAVVDWRGQGLSDRLCAQRLVGHVKQFTDYQIDLAAVMTYLAPRPPQFLMAHSMGGAIALRAMGAGLPVRAAALTAPMWGMGFSRGLHGLARVLSGVGELAGLGHCFAPGTGIKAYVKNTEFAANMLTTDAETFAWLRRQVTLQPDLAVAGPSLHWLREAMAECRALRSLPCPPVPTLCALGGAERIVDSGAIRHRMAQWAQGTLDIVPGAEHEVMMEAEPVRTRFFDQATELFAAHR